VAGPSPTPRLLLEGVAFPEGPRWRDGELWFVDMWGGAVWRANLDGEKELVAEIDGRPAGLGFLPDGSPIVVEMASRRILRLLPGGATEVHADRGGGTPYDCNDMHVDDAGRAYVGEFGYDYLAAEPPAPAKLILAEPDGSARAVADGLEFPNGIATTADGRTLLVAESAASRVSAFDVAADGSLSNRRLWGESEGFLDGLCVDAAAAAWVSTHSNGAFVRIEDGGNVTDRIEVPRGRWAIACALGGPELRTLFMFSVEVEGEDYAGAAGRIHTVEVDVPGIA
jgi:sugar lactone lactonase YvrE